MGDVRCAAGCKMGMLNGYSCGACGGTGKATIGMPFSQPPEDRQRHHDALERESVRRSLLPVMVDPTIPHNEVHFRDREGRTVAMFQLAAGQIVAIPHKLPGHGGQ